MRSLRSVRWLTIYGLRWRVEKWSGSPVDLLTINKELQSNQNYPQLPDERTMIKHYWQLRCTYISPSWSKSKVKSNKVKLYINRKVHSAHGLVSSGNIPLHQCSLICRRCSLYTGLVVADLFHAKPQYSSSNWRLTVLKQVSWCLFCQETSNTTQNTNSSGHLSAHIVHMSPLSHKETLPAPNTAAEI